MTDDKWLEAASWAGLSLLAAPLAYSYMGAKMKEPKKMESDNEQVLLGLVMRLAKSLDERDTEVEGLREKCTGRDLEYSEILKEKKAIEIKLDRVQATLNERIENDKKERHRNTTRLNEICQLRSIRDVRMAIRELLIMETPK